MKVKELIKELEMLNPEKIIKAVLIPTAWKTQKTPINLKNIEDIALFDIKEVTLSKPNVIALTIG